MTMMALRSGALTSTWQYYRISHKAFVDVEKDKIIENRKDEIDIIA